MNRNTLPLALAAALASFPAMALSPQPEAPPAPPPHAAPADAPRHHGPRGPEHHARMEERVAELKREVGTHMQRWRAENPQFTADDEAVERNLFMMRAMHRAMRAERGEHPRHMRHGEHGPSAERPAPPVR